MADVRAAAGDRSRCQRLLAGALFLALLMAGLVLNSVMFPEGDGCGYTDSEPRSDSKACS